MSQPKTLKPLDGVDIADLRALLEHPGWKIFASHLEWLDADQCEAMRNCAPEELRRLQGLSDGFRVSKDLPATLIAEWDAMQAQGARK